MQGQSLYGKLFMATFEVKGGTPLEGEIRPQGAKNEALQVLCATLLTPEKVIIHNIPAIVDVLQLIELFEKMGVIVHRLGEGSLLVRGEGDRFRLPAERRLPRPGGPVARFGDDYRAAAGALPESVTSRSRAATKSDVGGWTRISSVFRSSGPNSISIPARTFFPFRAKT